MANIFQSIFKSRKKNLGYAKLINGSTPIFTQFGSNIFASDVVQSCIDIIATECSKLQLKHIWNKADGTQVIPKDALDYLLRYAPNEMMTSKDFIEKIIWQLYLNYNCFIYPIYKVKEDN